MPSYLHDGVAFAFVDTHPKSFEDPAVDLVLVDSSQQDIKFPDSQLSKVTREVDEKESLAEDVAETEEAAPKPLEPILDEKLVSELNEKPRDLLVPVLIDDVELENDDSVKLIEKLGEPDPDLLPTDAHSSPMHVKIDEIVPLEVDAEIGTLDWQKITPLSEDQTFKPEEKVEPVIEEDSEPKFKGADTDSPNLSVNSDVPKENFTTIESSPFEPQEIEEVENEEPENQLEFELQKRFLTGVKQESVDQLDTSGDIIEPIEGLEDMETEQLESELSKTFLHSEKIPVREVTENVPLEVTDEQLPEMPDDKQSRFLAVEKVDLTPEEDALVPEEGNFERQSDSAEYPQKRHLAAGSIPVVGQELEAVDEKEALPDEIKPDSASRFLTAEINVLKGDHDLVEEPAHDSEEILTESVEQPYHKSQSELRPDFEKRSEVQREPEESLQEKLESEEKLNEPVFEQETKPVLNEKLKTELEPETSDTLVPVLIDDVELENDDAEKLIQEMGDPDSDAVTKRFSSAPVPSNIDEIVALNEKDAEVGAFDWPKITHPVEQKPVLSDMYEPESAEKVDSELEDVEQKQTDNLEQLLEPESPGLMDQRTTGVDQDSLLSDELISQMGRNLQLMSEEFENIPEDRYSPALLAEGVAFAKSDTIQELDDSKLVSLGDVIVLRNEIAASELPNDDNETLEQHPETSDLQGASFEVSKSKLDSAEMLDSSQPAVVAPEIEEVQELGAIEEVDHVKSDRPTFVDEPKDQIFPTDVDSVSGVSYIDKVDENFSSDHVTPSQIEESVIASEVQPTQALEEKTQRAENLAQPETKIEEDTLRDVVESIPIGDKFLVTDETVNVIVQPEKESSAEPAVTLLVNVVSETSDDTADDENVLQYQSEPVVQMAFETRDDDKAMASPVAQPDTKRGISTKVDTSLIESDEEIEEQNDDEIVDQVNTESRKRFLTSLEAETLDRFPVCHDADAETEETEQIETANIPEPETSKTFLHGEKIPQLQTTEDITSEEIGETPIDSEVADSDSHSRFLAAEKVELSPEEDALVPEDGNFEKQPDSAEYPQKRHLATDSIPVVGQELEAVDEKEALPDEIKPDSASRFLTAEMIVLKSDHDLVEEPAHDSEEILTESVEQPYHKSQSELRPDFEKRSEVQREPEESLQEKLELEEKLNEPVFEQETKPVLNEKLKTELEPETSDTLVPVLIDDVELENDDAEKLIQEMGDPDTDAVTKRFSSAPVPSNIDEIVALNEKDAEVGAFDWPKITHPVEQKPVLSDMYEPESAEKVDSELEEDVEQKQTDNLEQLLEPESPEPVDQETASIPESGTSKTFLHGEKIPQLQTTEDITSEEIGETPIDSEVAASDSHSRFLATDKIELSPEEDTNAVDDESIEKEGQEPHESQTRHLVASSIPMVGPESLQYTKDEALIMEGEKPEDDTTSRCLRVETSVVQGYDEPVHETDEIPAVVSDETETLQKVPDFKRGLTAIETKVEPQESEPQEVEDIEEEDDEKNKRQSQVIASDDVFKQSLPRTEVDPSGDSEELKQTALEINPLKDVTLQNIKEINKKFYHLSVKRIKQQGEVITEYRRYGLDAPELQNVQPSPEYFLENPEQYVELTRKDSTSTGEVFETVRYYKHDDPELLKYLRQTGVTNVLDLASISKEIEEPGSLITRFDVSNFLKGSLEYYLNDNIEYDVFVKYAAPDSEDSESAEMRHYVSTDAEIKVLNPSEIQDTHSAAVPFEGTYYQTSLVFVLKNGKTLHVKRWTDKSDALFASLLTLEFEIKPSADRIPSNLQKTRNVDVKNDFLTNFMPHEFVQFEPCQVLIAISEVQSVRVSEVELKSDEGFMQTNVDVYSHMGAGKQTQVTRHSFFTRAPEIVAVTQKTLVFKQKGETKTLGSLLEVKKTSLDDQGRLVTNTSRLINPDDEVFNSDDVRPVKTLLSKWKISSPRIMSVEHLDKEFFLHTCHLAECPKVELENPEMSLKFSETNRFSLDETFDKNGQGERILISQSDKRKESFAVSRTYRSIILKVLVNRTPATYPQRLIEFSVIRKDDDKNQTKRSTFWIPSTAKEIPEFYRHKVSLKKSSLKCFFNVPESEKLSAQKLLMGLKTIPNATEVIQHLDAIDIAKFEKLDRNELVPDLKGFEVCVQIRHLGSISVSEHFDGTSRHFIVSRECLENNQRFTMTSYYSSKACLVRKMTKSLSTQNIFGLISPEKAHKKKASPKKASKLYLALQTEDEAAKISNKRPDEVVEVRSKNINSVEIKSSKAEKKFVKFGEEEIADDEILEVCDSPSVGISVKQIKTPDVSDESVEEKFIILEKTIADPTSGRKTVQRKKFSVTDESLVGEIEKDPNAIVVPYDATEEPELSAQTAVELEENENLKLSSTTTLNINIETDDGRRFKYKFVDGKVISQEHLPIKEEPTVSSDVILGEGFSIPLESQTPESFGSTSPSKKKYQKVKRKILRVVSPETGSKMTLEEALRSNVIDSDMYKTLKERSSKTKKTKIFDPSTNSEMSVEAVKNAGIILPQVTAVEPIVVEKPKEETTNEKKQEKALTNLVSDDPMLKEKDAQSELYSPLSVVATSPVVLMHPKKELLANLVKRVSLIDPITEERISLEEGRRRGLLDETTYREMKLKERIDTGVPITDEEYQQMKDNGGKLTVSKSSETLYFPEEAELGEGKMQFLQQLNPQVEVQHAFMIEPSPTDKIQLKDGKVSADEAFKRGLIDHSTYCDLKEIDTSIELVTIQTTQTVPVRSNLGLRESPVTPTRPGIEKPKEPRFKFEEVPDVPMVYDANSGSVIRPDEALKIGLIDKRTYHKLLFEITSVLEPEPIESPSLRDNFELVIKVAYPGTDALLSPAKAFESGLINSDTCEILEERTDKIVEEIPRTSRIWQMLHFSVIDKTNLASISLDDALALNVISPELYQLIHEMSHLDLDESLDTEKEEVDETSSSKGMILITDPESGEQKSLDEALDFGLIDELKYLELKAQERMGIHELKVSQIQGGIYISHSETNETFSPEEAFARGLISLGVFQRLRSEANKNDEIPTVQRRPLPTKIVITDKSSGKTYTLDEALEHGLIDKETYDRVISKAFSSDISDNSSELPTVTIQDPFNSQLYSLAEAYRKRIISHAQYKVLKSKETDPVDFGPEKVVFVPGRVSIVDPVTNEEFSLEEALGLGYFDMESYLALRNASVAKSDLLTLATSGLSVSQELMSDPESKVSSRAVSTMSLVQVSAPKLVHFTLENSQLPNVYNLNSGKFSTNEKGSEVRQLPGIFVFPVHDSDIEVSPEEAKHRKLISKEECEGLDATLVSEVDKFCLLVFANLVLQKSETEFMPIHDAVEKKIITEFQLSDIRSRFNATISAYRIFALFQRSAEINVLNAETQQVDQVPVKTRQLIATFPNFPPISIVSKGCADVWHLVDALLDNVVERQAVENYLTSLYFDNSMASFLLLYIPEKKTLYPADKACISEHLTVEGYYKIAQIENREKSFVKKTASSEFLLTAAEALVQGLISDCIYDSLIQKLPDETLLSSLQVFDPYSKNVSSLEEAFTSGVLNFSQLQSVLVRSATSPAYMPKLTVVDRGTNSVMTPENALETNLISSEEFESLFLNFTRGFEKVLSSKIKILNPKTAEIFTIEDAMNLGYMTYEKYNSLSQIAIEVPQGVPSLLVLTEKGELLSPVVGYLEGSLSKEIYKNLFHEHAEFLHPLKPSGIAVYDTQDACSRSLEESFSLGLVHPEAYSDTLAKLVENFPDVASFLVRNPEEGSVVSLKQALETNLIDIKTLDSFKPKDVFRYKNSSTTVVDLNTGKIHPLKEGIEQKMFKLSDVLDLTDSDNECQSPLVWDKVSEKFMTFDDAVQNHLIPPEGIEQLSQSFALLPGLEYKIKIVNEETFELESLQSAFQSGKLSEKVYSKILEVAETTPHVLTKVLVYDKKSKDIFNLYESVRRQIVTPEKVKKLLRDTKSAGHFLESPGLSVYSKEFNTEMNLEEAISNNYVSLENAAVILERLRTEPEILTKCLLVDESLGCLITPQEALASGALDLIELQSLQQNYPKIREPLKDTGVVIYVSETEEIVPLFDVFATGLIDEETFREFLQKLKVDPELVTKMMVLDSEAGNFLTPIAAVDLELLDVETFDELAENQSDMLMPIRSSGISVLHIGTDVVVPIEKSVLNGMLSPEVYNETLNRYKRGTEFLCKLMMYNPLSDEVLTLDEAFKKKIVESERYNAIATAFPESFESVNATGLNVFILPSKRFATLEEALRQRLIPHTIYQQLLNKVVEEPHCLTKTVVFSSLNNQISSFDEALRNGILSAEDYKRFYDLHPKEADQFLSFSFLILDSDSGKIMSSDDAIRDQFTNLEKLTKVTQRAAENPYSVTKVMVVDPNTGDLYTPSEAVISRCLSPNLFQELRDLHPNAFEGTIPTGITVVLENGAEILMLENAVMSGRLSTGVYETITQTLLEDPSQVTKVMVLNPETGCLVSLKAGLDEGIISHDLYNSFINNNPDCLESIRPCEVFVLDNFSGEIIAIEVAVHRGHISSQKYLEVLAELNDFPEAWKKLVLIDDYGELVSPEDAVEFGYINEEFYLQLKETFPEGFKPVKHNQLKVLDIVNGELFSLTEALKSGVITSLMYDSLMSDLQNCPEKVTKIMTVHPRMNTLMPAHEALSKGFLDQAKLEALKCLHPGIAQPVFIPTFKVFDIQTETQYLLKDLIRQNKVSEAAVSEVFAKMVQKPEEITKNLLFIDEQNPLIPLSRALENGLIDEPKCLELSRVLPDTIEPWNLPSEIRTLDTEQNQLIPLDRVPSRGLMKMKDFVQVAKNLAASPAKLGKLVVFDRDTRLSKTLETAIREGQVDQKTLNKLRSDASTFKHNRQPTGLCLYSPDQLTVTPVETSLNAGEISQDTFDALYENFQHDSSKVPGLLIVKEGVVLRPSEALNKNVIAPSQIRALQQEYPEAFSPQSASRITILDPSTNQVMPLECALNMGLLTPEEFVSVASKVGEDPKSFSTSFAFIDFQSKEIRKPPVSIICSTFDPETYAKSITDSQEKAGIADDDIFSVASSATDISDTPETVVYDPKTKLFVTPTAAANKGLIETPELPAGSMPGAFGVAGIIDETTRTIIHPSEAIQKKLISQEVYEQLFSSSESLASQGSAKAKVEERPPKKKGPSKVTIAKPTIAKKPTKPIKSESATPPLRSGSGSTQSGLKSPKIDVTKPASLKSRRSSLESNSSNSNRSPKTTPTTTTVPKVDVRKKVPDKKPAPVQQKTTPGRKG